MQLYERESVLERVEAALHDAEDGHGRVLAIEGPPGIGKTALAGAACERARAAGVETLSARSGELEAGLPFGIVRQLFEVRVMTSDDAARAEILAGAAALARPVLGFDDEDVWASANVVGDVASYPRLHGLYWLAVNLAVERPLMLVVDDAHWADLPSLRWLGYLAARIDALPILVLIASRPEAHDPIGTLEVVMSDPRTELLRPSPLSSRAVEAMVRDTLGERAQPGFSAACGEATGGNPFFLRELLTDLSLAGVSPTDDAADRVGRVGPRKVARDIRRRLAALGQPATALARAVAVLGASAEHRHAAALLEADDGRVAEIAAVLLDAGILEADQPLRFVHPIVRAAIYGDTPTAERIAGHRTAARVLAAESATPERIGMHLLATPPGRDSWVVQTLRTAARGALARGAPASATAYLRRALDEASGSEPELDILAELGHAEVIAGEPTAVERLERALARTRDPERRAELAIELGRALTVSGRPDDAARLLARVVAMPQGVDPDTVLRVDAELINASRLDKDTRDLGLQRLERVSPELRGERPGERLMLAHLAYEAVCTAEPAGHVVELARRALSGGALLREAGCESPTYYVAAWALGLADRLGESVAALSAALDAAAAQGSALGFAIAASFRASIHYRRGALAEAEADARNVSDAADHGWHPLGTAFLVDTLVDRGQLHEAEATLDRIGMLGEIPENLLFQPLLYARSGLRLAQGRDEDALADLAESGRRAIAARVRTPAFRDWRSASALVLARLGRQSEAWALATEELDLARRFGAPRSLGIALRAMGLLERDAARNRLLGESVAVLRDAGVPVEHSRSLLELGAARRRDGERAAAREPLREALEIAHRCGADPLAARAREELAAAGSRPRRPVRSGVDALTASERRVAGLAADGMTNREIAQALFVTLKTVEWHLAQVYRKLDVPGRTGLPTIMTAAAARSGDDDRARAAVAR